MRPVLKTIGSHWRSIALYSGLLLAGWLMADLLRLVTFPEMRPMNEPMIHRLMTVSVVAYVLTAALPFVPGAEIGFAMLLIFGAPAAPIVYAGMVGALSLSYGVARLLPPKTVCAGFRRLGFHRFADLLAALRATPQQERDAWLARQLPGRLAPFAMRNRSILLILLINTPGNSLIGGGGGIAFIAGISGLFAPLHYLACVAIAVAPLPLAFAVLDARGASPF